MDPITLAITLAAKYAPDIVKHFTNNDTAAEVAAKVIDIAQTVTGTSTPDAAALAMDTDPALALQFKTAVMANELELEKLRLGDIANARSHDTDVRKLNDGHNRRADYMVALDVVGLIACLLVLCFYRASIPAEAVGLISTIAATFGLCLRDAHQFEFGSSRSSQTKDNTINNLSK